MTTTFLYFNLFHPRFLPCNIPATVTQNHNSINCYTVSNRLLKARKIIHGIVRAVDSGSVYGRKEGPAASVPGASVPSEGASTLYLHDGSSSGVIISGLGWHRNEYPNFH